MKSKIKNAYNKLGQEYYEARKYKTGISYFYNNLLEMPTTLKMMGNIKGKRILDLGCGPGIYAKLLTDKGAIVKGIDISKEELKYAKIEAPKAEFKLGDANRLPYKDSEFDIVLSALVMGHIKDWNKPLKEIRRVLKKGGIFIFSNYNPVTEKMRKTKWFFKTFREVNNYFKEGWRYNEWKERGITVEGAHHHKTYGTIVKLLVKHGFEIIDYADCKPIPVSKKLFPERYEKTMNSPNFCTWKVKKK
jgi:ubiquinone/menaquinone biosynthesis C-methylase UbiE